MDGSVHLNPNSNAAALQLTFASGSGVVGYANGGIGNEGLSWQEGSEYVGFAWVLAPAGGMLYAGAHDRGSNNSAAGVRASASLPLAPSSQWQRVNFSLIPSADASCEGIEIGSDPSLDCGAMGMNPGHVCVRCGGEFVIGLSAPTTTSPVWVGYVDFAVGSWGTFGPNGVARKSTVDAVVGTMGVTAIRQGGAVSVGMKWKDFRGAPWMRPSMQRSWNGDLLMANWGPFEFLDMAAAAGVEATLTFDYQLNTVNDWADLVEYCWGNETTAWGAVRIFNDSHPEPYIIRALEIGNEQNSPDFVAEVAAMETRRAEVGAPELRYLYPAIGWPPTQSMPNATAQGLWAIGGEELAGRSCTDIHTGVNPSGGGGVDRAYQGASELAWFPQCFYNCEVNAYFSGFQRAVTEGWDLTQFFNVNASFQHRLQARMASFCTQRSGHFNGFDQGMIFTLPNATILQPPAHTHALVTQALAQARNALAVSTSYAGGNNAWLSVSSQIADDGSVLVVQASNMNPGGPDGTVTLTLAGAGFTPSGAVEMRLLSDPAADGAAGLAPDMNAGNTPAQPDRIVPTTQQLRWPSGAPSFTFSLPAFSFAVVYIYA